MMLRPIISRFVSAFDGNPDVDFWNRVCHVHPQGSGPSYLSGWITAFCVWTNKGKWLGPQLPSPNQESINAKTDKDTLKALVLDSVKYPIIDTLDVPFGFCDVDIKLDDNGINFDCMMVAGHLASVVGGEHSNSLRPAPAWFMFIKG